MEDELKEKVDEKLGSLRETAARSWGSLCDSQKAKPSSAVREVVSHVYLCLFCLVGFVPTIDMFSFNIQKSLNFTKLFLC